MSNARKSSREEPTSARDATSQQIKGRTRAVFTDCYARSARTFARKITQVYDRHLASHGFTLPQFAMLAMIAATKDDTLAALAAEADLDPSTLTRNLQGLEKLGLVEIATVETDQRRRSVRLTASGAQRLATALPAWEAAQQEITAALGARLGATLTRASAAL